MRYSFLISLFVTVAILLAACGDAESNSAPTDTAVALPISPTATIEAPPGPDVQHNLDMHRELWGSQEPFEYAIEYSSKCFGRCTPEPTEVVIEDGRVRSYGGYHVVRMDSRIRRNLPFHTVDELFDMLQYAIDQNAYRMDVTYNAEAGYPESADIDYQSYGVDDEWSFEIAGYLDLDRDSEGFQEWTKFAKAVCNAWSALTTDYDHHLIRAADTMRHSSPPEELAQYRDWWVAALQGTSPKSDDTELAAGIAERTAAHPLLYAVAMCDLPRGKRLDKEDGTQNGQQDYQPNQGTTSLHQGS